MHHLHIRFMCCAANVFESFSTAAAAVSSNVASYRPRIAIWYYGLLWDYEPAGCTQRHYPMFQCFRFLFPSAVKLICRLFRPVQLSSLLDSVNLYSVLTLLLVHLILHITSSQSPSPSLSPSITASFTPDLKHICSTNLFFHYYSLSGSFCTAFMGLQPVPD